MSKGKAFYYRCKCGPELTEQQFRHLVQTGLSLECNGDMCDLYSDWKAEDGLFWDTTSWTLGGNIAPTPSGVKDALEHFARHALRKQGFDVNNRSMDDFVTFKLVVVDLDQPDAKAEH